MCDSVLHRMLWYTKHLHSCCRRTLRSKFQCTTTPTVGWQDQSHLWTKRLAEHSRGKRKRFANLLSSKISSLQVDKRVLAYSTRHWFASMSAWRPGSTLPSHVTQPKILKNAQNQFQIQNLYTRQRPVAIAQFSRPALPGRNKEGCWKTCEMWAYAWVKDALSNKS